MLKNTFLSLGFILLSSYLKAAATMPHTFIFEREAMVFTMAYSDERLACYIKAGARLQNPYSEGTTTIVYFEDIVLKAFVKSDCIAKSCDSLTKDYVRFFNIFAPGSGIPPETRFKCIEACYQFLEAVRILEESEAKEDKAGEKGEFDILKIGQRNLARFQHLVTMLGASPYLASQFIVG